MVFKVENYITMEKFNFDYVMRMNFFKLNSYLFMHKSICNLKVNCVIN